MICLIVIHKKDMQIFACLFLCDFVSELVKISYNILEVFMKNVLLVFGGESYEHDISIVTAFQIYKKTKLSEVRLILFYISRDGRYYICDPKRISVMDLSRTKFRVNLKGIREVAFVSGEKEKLFIKTRFGLKEIYDVKTAIFACHGGDGENGRLVSLFERCGIACSVGSSDALAVCMDKFLFKSFAKGLGVPVVTGFKLTKHDFLNNKNEIIYRLSRIHFPVILKPNNGGSSIGLFIAKNIDDFLVKIKDSFEFGEEIIVEKFIEDAREFNVAVLGDANFYEVSDIDEPIKNNEVLTFVDKYLSGDAKNCKAKGSMTHKLNKEINLSEKNQMKIKSIASKIFIKLGLHGVVRIDFLFDEKNDKIYVCEVNTIPGSLAYYFFKKNKILVNDLVEKLINVANNNFDKVKINNNLVVDILSENNSSN